MQPNTHPKALAIVYWVTTSLVVFNFTFGGVSSLLGSASSAKVFSRLGYPGYFGCCSARRRCWRRLRC